MKSNQNRARIPSVPATLTALASGLTLAFLTSGPATADAQPQRGSRPTRPVEQKAPLTALTGVIKRLEEGGSVTVPAKSIELADAIGTAKGRPIEFTDGDQTYFAYRQGSKPDFHASPQAVAASMAIMDAQFPSDSNKLPSVTAHLNSNHELVAGSKHTPVGFAVGGGDAPQS